MSDGEIVQKQGEIIAVLPQKSGFTEIQIQEEGRQYPYKASTKLPDIIEAANAGLFQQAVLTAKEVDSGNPNPHQPGKNYINRTAMKVEVGGTVSAPEPSRNAAPAASPTHAPLPPGDKDRAITRMAVLKAAAEIAAAYAGSDSGEEYVAATHAIEMAARFETWVYRDVDDIPF